MLESLARAGRTVRTAALVATVAGTALFAMVGVTADEALHRCCVKASDCRHADNGTACQNGDDCKNAGEYKLCCADAVCVGGGGPILD